MSGAQRYFSFSNFSSKNVTYIFMESSFGNISRRVANWAGRLYRCFSKVFNVMSTKIHLDRISLLFLYGYIYIKDGKVGAFEFSRISRRDRVGKNIALNFFLFFFLHVQCGVRPFVIQSDFTVENGRVRRKLKSSFLVQSKRGFFDSNVFD